MKNIAILLTCHNRKSKTIQCLDALYACDLPNEYCFDIYLVDDGSTDGTTEAVRAEYSKVNIIQGSGNLYWNRGMYLAWQSAVKQKEYDFYIWLNDDTILFKNAIDLFVIESTKENFNSILVGATRDSNYKISYSAYSKDGLKLFPNGHWQKSCYFNGNFVLIPKNVFKSIGYNDKFYRHSFGDFDYGYRAFKKGFDVLLSPIPLGYCDSNISKKKWLDKNYSLLKRLKFLYSPLGNNPLELLYINFKQNKIIQGIFQFLNIHIKVIFKAL